MMLPEEIIRVVNAHLEGKLIQYRRLNGSAWSDHFEGSEVQLWDFAKYDFREKPAPFELWIAASPSKTFMVFQDKPKTDKALEGWTLHRMREVEEVASDV